MNNDLHTTLQREALPTRDVSDPRESERHYRLLFENNPQPMWVFDSETLAFLEVNDAAIRQYGYSRDEFLSMSLEDIRPAEDIPVLIEACSQHTAVCSESRAPWRHKRKDGSVIDVEVSWHSFELAGRPARLALLTFKIYMPRVDVPETTDVAEVRQTARGGQETILLVEDEEIVRDLAREVLEYYGYTVITAENGEEGLRVCREFAGRIDLVLTDVVMPRMSGRELAEQLAVERPGTRVLYMSGFTDDAIVRHGLLEEDIAFIQKPFTPESLATKMRELLDNFD